MTSAAPGQSPWITEFLSGNAHELHQSEMPPAQRCVRLHSLTRPAVVLGSAQVAGSRLGSSEKLAVVAAEVLEQFGCDLAVRRSGGGAVWLSPGDQCWVDIWLPAGDPLWRSDVGQSSWWLGECWAEALAETSQLAAQPVVHRGPLLHRDLAEVACFAGLGPGEVTVDQKKIVGISQRRSRLGARFQCVVYTHWDPKPLLEVLQSCYPQTAAGTEFGHSLGDALNSGVLAVQVAPAEQVAPAPSGVTAERQILDALLASLPR
ncbi:MAG: hypothetical protein F2942_02525 [Actinobacteria bacterium]|uniref:Unannotated protein n=1 Tax=freshwater metagenome TaxID=449393 RepID=A0A6J7UIK4_9ZZZZ|nr:hypothetical protein [Actinomycetota bacterium]